MTSENFTLHSIEKIFRGRFSIASNVKLLWKGIDTFKNIFDSVKAAKEQICLAFYIFRNDETGEALSEILKEKSREGVKVYLLYDHFGSLGTPGSFWKGMKNAGIRIMASRPFKWTNPLHYVHRDHRKLIIIDMKKAFTGGLNIANEYSGFHVKHKESSWRDTGILLDGPIAGELFKNFAKSWYAWGGEKIEYPHCYAKRLHDEKQESLLEFSDLWKHRGGLLTMPIFSDSAKGRRKMRRLLYYSINHAQKSINLTTAYFIPSWRMIETLVNAVKRGVKVRLLVPDISDVPAASYAGRAFFMKLLNAGVDIHTYLGQILHAKTYVFDDCWSIIGSTNLDFQSFRYNDEGNVGILDKGFASNLINIFEEDIKNSQKIEPESWKNRPFFDKLKEHFFSIFRRRL
jgi:cardiolipin synthase